jgi:hypothetical protein
MATFDELVSSRKQWIEDVLKPWCRDANLKGLKQADAEWGDIAGRASQEATLWTWAWSRFPDLVHEGLIGVDETCAVAVSLIDGSRFVGFPDARAGKKGELVLVCSVPQDSTRGPFSIDDIANVQKVESTEADSQ